MTASNQEIRELLLAIPKTEIHLHIEGLASVDTIWSLMQKNKLDYGINNIDELRRKFLVKNLDEFIALFINIIQNSFQEESDLELLISDTRNYLSRNNIFYAELFFSPSKFILNGFDYSKMVEILNAGAKVIKCEDGREVRFIADVSRTYGPDNAMNNLDLILNNPVDSFIGIGLGGAESQGPAAKFEAVFAKAVACGLRVVAHAGEVEGPFSIWESLKRLNVARIGHGTSAVYDDKLMDYLATERIPIEVCPTSNLFTRQFVHAMEDHPIKTFYERGLNVTLNTDDPTLFGVELIDEYMNLMDAGLFSLEELLDILKNTHFATFMDEKEKENSWKEAEKVIALHRQLS